MQISFGRTVSYFAVTGMAVPIIFQLVWWIVDIYGRSASQLWIPLQKLMLVLWPTSLIGLRAPPGAVLGFFVLAMAANVVLYAIVGSAVWYGLVKHRAALLLPVILMGGI